MDGWRNSRPLEWDDWLSAPWDGWREGGTADLDERKKTEVVVVLA
jgi:hypothetical protein